MKKDFDFTVTQLSILSFQKILDRAYQKFRLDPRIHDESPHSPRPDSPDDLFLKPEITLVIPEDVLASLNSSVTINWNKDETVSEDMPATGVVYGYNPEGETFIASAWWRSVNGWRSIIYVAPHGDHLSNSSATYAPFLGMPHIMEFLQLAKNPEFGFSEEVRGDTHFFRYSLPKPVAQSDIEKLSEFHMQPRALPRYAHEIRKKRDVPRAIKDSIWWISEELSLVVWDTVLTGTTPDDLLDEKLPGPYGIMYFDGGSGLPLPCVPFYGPEKGTIQFLTINAVIWDRNFDRGELLVDKNMDRVNFSSVQAANGAFLNYPDSSGSSFSLMTDCIGSPDWSIENTLGFSRRSIDELAEKLVKTALRMSRMDYLAENHSTFVEPITKSERKKAKREGREPDTIVVATLRRAKNQAHDDLIDPEGREYSHRWIVRGHDRKQLIGNRGSQEKIYKNVWIAPYVKGPWDKPLIVKDKVNVWRR